MRKNELAEMLALPIVLLILYLAILAPAILEGVRL